MTVYTKKSRRVLTALCALFALTAISPEGATATGTTTQRTIGGIPIPASVHVSGTTATTAPATTTQAPATTTTAPASGAQPGNVAPGSTATTATPTTSVPATTTPQSATTPTATVPTTTPTVTTPGASTTVVGVSHKTSPSKRLSTGALALAILGALLALGCAVWIAGRWMALEPRWTISMMHSLREASYHASATWAEFSDWAKLGR